MVMKVVQKWGNSLGIRIPKHIAERARLHEGCMVEVDATDGQVVITAARSRRRCSLDDLLAGITKDNLHGEIDTGARVGGEAL